MLCAAERGAQGDADLLRGNESSILQAPLIAKTGSRI
jgi:hypothetical protein